MGKRKRPKRIAPQQAAAEYAQWCYWVGRMLDVLDKALGKVGITQRERCVMLAQRREVEAMLDPDVPLDWVRRVPLQAVIL